MNTMKWPTPDPSEYADRRAEYSAPGAGDDWDVDELEALAADAEAERESTPLPLPARHTGRYNSSAPALMPRAVPMRVTGAGTVPAIGWLREIRLAQAQGLMSKREAREWLCLPPRRWWHLGR